MRGFKSRPPELWLLSIILRKHYFPTWITLELQTSKKWSKLGNIKKVYRLIQCPTQCCSPRSTSNVCSMKCLPLCPVRKSMVIKNSQKGSVGWQVEADWKGMEGGGNTRTISVKFDLKPKASGR